MVLPLGNRKSRVLFWLFWIVVSCPLTMPVRLSRFWVATTRMSRNGKNSWTSSPRGLWKPVFCRGTSERWLCCLLDWQRRGTRWERWRLPRLEPCAICRSQWCLTGGTGVMDAESCLGRIADVGCIWYIVESPSRAYRCTGTAGTESGSGRLHASGGSSRWTWSGSYGHWWSVRAVLGIRRRQYIFK